jgi:hypothetical protein
LLGVAVILDRVAAPVFVAIEMITGMDLREADAAEGANSSADSSDPT